MRVHDADHDGNNDVASARGQIGEGDAFEGRSS